MDKKLLEAIKSGRTDIFYNSWTWRKKSKERIEAANNECQLCKNKGLVTVGTKDNPLHTHHKKHLKDRPDLALDDKNLLVVCKPCHEGEHPEIYKEKEKPFINVERWE